MKKHIPAATLAVGIIALCAVLGGCNGEGQTPSVQTTTTSVTTSATVKSTTASQTSPQATSSTSSITTVTTKETTTTSAVTITKQTEPPATVAPITDPPKTDPPQTDPPQTEPSPPYIITPTADGGQGLQQRRCTYRRIKFIAGLSDDKAEKGDERQLQDTGKCR